MRAGAVAACLVCAGCGASVRGSDAGDDGSPPTTDAAPDAMLPAFASIMKLPRLATDAAQEDDPTLSTDETEIILGYDIPNVSKDLYRATRATATDNFDDPVRIAELSSGSADETPRLTVDGRTLYFSSTRSGGMGGADIWMSTRSGPGQPWDPPAPVAYANSGAADRAFSPCTGGRYVVMSERDGTDGNLYEGALGTAPTMIAELSTTSEERGPYLTPDCLHLFFVADRGGTDYDVIAAHRDAIDAPWIDDGRFAELETGANESDPWVSPDLRRMILTSNVDGERDLYYPSR